jgi:hypothetical protein
VTDLTPALVGILGFDSRVDVVDEPPASFDRPTLVVHSGRPSPLGLARDCGHDVFGQEWQVTCVSNSRKGAVTLAGLAVAAVDGAPAGRGVFRVEQVSDPIVDDETAGLWRWSVTLFVAR